MPILTGYGFSAGPVLPAGPAEGAHVSLHAAEISYPVGSVFISLRGVRGGEVLPTSALTQAAKFGAAATGEEVIGACERCQALRLGPPSAWWLACHC